jgi:uncharacterized protein YggU (UPF0235/DUF167 family)
VTGEPWRRVSGGLEIRLRVTPKSRGDEISGLHTASDGSLSLAIKVRAVPDKGAANRAVIETLASALGIPKLRLSLIAGATGRNKAVLVEGDARELAGRVAGLLGRPAGEKN